MIIIFFLYQNAKNYRLAQAQEPVLEHPHTKQYIYSLGLRLMLRAKYLLVSLVKEIK